MHFTHRYSPALQQMVSWLMTVSPSERPFINEVIQRVETLQYSAENRVWHLSQPFFCDERSTWPCHVRGMCWNMCTWGSVFSSVGKLIAVRWGTCVTVINRYAPSAWDTLSLLTGAASMKCCRFILTITEEQWLVSMMTTGAQELHLQDLVWHHEFQNLVQFLRKTLAWFQSQESSMTVEYHNLVRRIPEFSETLEYQNLMRLEYQNLVRLLSTRM